MKLEHLSTVTQLSRRLESVREMRARIKDANNLELHFKQGGTPREMFDATKGSGEGAALFEAIHTAVLLNISAEEENILEQLIRLEVRP